MRRTLFIGFLLFGLVWSAVLDTAEPLPSQYDDQLAILDQLALEQAYVAQMTKLFQVWMADAHGQPERAMSGARRARQAYIAVMQDRERRR